jgi:hypothetical protein
MLSRCLVSAVIAVLALGGCAGSGKDARSTGVTPAEPSAAAGPNLSDADLWLSFEDESVGYDGSVTYPDELRGPFSGRVVTANHGRVRRSPGAEGGVASVAFPPKCLAPIGCPRAMVEVAPDRALDPGAHDFEYGASVWLAPDQTTTGSNIVQKGRFGTDGGQWKLQVDNRAGQPSCVVRSGATALVVRSSVSVADSAWHRVTCRRDPRGVSIRVDETVDRKTGRTGSVSSQWPIRIGSPGVGDGDDQFHGRIDDVFIRIDRS